MTSLADEKDAIRELMAAYCYALDACRFDEVAALFAEQGEWTTSYGAARGRAEIAALLDRTVPKPGEGPQRKHYITNIIVSVDGDRVGNLGLSGRSPERVGASACDGWPLQGCLREDRG